MNRITVFFVCLALAFAAHAATITGRVVKVADGDTITVLDRANTQHKIRLAGLDAPERRQDFGNVSRESLAAMVAGKSVTVRTGKLDRYGRAVGVVLVGDVDVNRIQIERGLAWWYRAYAAEQTPTDRIAYERAENAAKAARRGLWAMPAPVAPWDWRRGLREVHQPGKD